jgi:hypothetical protein
LLRTYERNVNDEAIGRALCRALRFFQSSVARENMFLAIAASATNGTFRRAHLPAAAPRLFMQRSTRQR